ncbi:MAG: hypothetical protein ACR2RB_15780 [Gammaproteobacteria bacterium]
MKNARMNDFPHPFIDVPREHEVCLLDPIDPSLHGWSLDKLSTLKLGPPIEGRPGPLGVTVRAFLSA